jgi:hypothetical protein
MGYAERCEYLAGEGLSGSDAAFYAGGGSVRGFFTDEDEDDVRDPNCPTEEEFDKNPGEYIWIEPFGSSFRVSAYDPTAKNGYEVYTVGTDQPTREAAETLRTEWVARVTAEIAEARQ